MGKRKKLNRLISKWIKSDLPEEHSTVLLLGVTRIPTSPTPARRPCSLPLGALPLRHISQPTFKPRRRSLTRPLSHLPNATVDPVTSSSPDSSGATPSNNISNGSSCQSQSADTVMDRSVDSIGTCSLDVDVSADLSDPSDVSSSGTLRSFSIPTPTPSPEQRLPSYLSLACTVNGYSTTTNYDPERLARSRDASPHRLHDHDHQELLTYTVHNNLLSPPNLVPLPLQRYKTKMDTQNKENVSEHRQFYSSSKTVTYSSSKETKSFQSIITNNDTVDACLENGARNGFQKKCVTYSTKNMSISSNGQSKYTSETKIQHLNGNECKSFIEQRVERLYGPGALAQGFFVTKRLKNRVSESESEKISSTNTEAHSKSFCEQPLEEGNCSLNMKQSSSSPSLPVLRHLRPEFRAQLPILTPKKGSESSMQKSSTIPTLKCESTVNGHSASSPMPKLDLNGKDNDVLSACKTAAEPLVVRDGHYFINILEIEAKRLLEMAHEAEKELEATDLPEEAKGYIRSASGKARLLVSQKMQQFKGLCTNNITQVEGEAFPTTNEDLQGFWDMVMLQVDQIDALFKEISVLRANNWQEVKPDTVDKSNVSNSNKTKKVLKVSKPPTAAAEEARKKREAQRKAMIEAKRKAMKEQKTEQTIEIFVPESS